ncbi:MAG TPA: hypothetical protein VMF57_21890 [Solirubrobacteraceae bacterium]|nr:hypothetical protein [Solirubrobacteraceae bacterium]
MARARMPVRRRGAPCRTQGWKRCTFPRLAERALAHRPDEACDYQDLDDPTHWPDADRTL